MMEVIDGTTVNRKVGLCQCATSESLSDVIGALRNIVALTGSQAIIPDLETPYSRSFPTTNGPVIEFKDLSISTILNKRQRQLDAVLHDISDLETVVDSIKYLTQKLVEKKDKINQSLNLHKRLVSALWRLPTEILSRIFSQCLSQFLQDMRPAKKDDAPILMTRICKRWREVAVGVPGLWRRIQFWGGEVHNERWQSAAFGYDLWLKRSRGLPLSMGVACYDADGSSIKLRSFLQPYINQIVSLSILAFHRIDAPELMFKDLPALQELILSVHKHSEIPRIAQSISPLSSTMRSLRVSTPMFKLEDFSPFTPVLTHLTNIEVAINRLDIFPHLLRLCPNLSSVTIRSGFTQQMQVIEPFTHIKLRSLRVALNPGDKVLYRASPKLPPVGTAHFSVLFDALSLPNLRVLEARYIEAHECELFEWLPSLHSQQLEGCYAQSWPHAELKALLERSNCPLENLVLGPGVMTTDEQRAEYVALVPSLKVVSHASR